jgi:mono/diheme cytochrome c family protein
MLFLASLVGLIGSGAVFMDRPAPTDPVDSMTEYSENKEYPDLISAPQDGAEIYLTRCMSCHQMNGGGVPGVFPPLTGTEWVTGDEGVLIRIILNGMTGEIEVNGMVYTGAMPPWGAFLNDEEMADLLTYIRTEWGNDASDITPEMVAEVREAVAEREEPWTIAELEAIREANR